MIFYPRSGHGSAPATRAESARSVVVGREQSVADWLRKIDGLLEDEAVIDVVAEALERRWPQSRRLGTPAEVVIRMLMLKHPFDWSYDDMEREVPRQFGRSDVYERAGDGAR